jgi:hypothetical protein
VSVFERDKSIVNVRNKGLISLPLIEGTGRESATPELLSPPNIGSTPFEILGHDTLHDAGHLDFSVTILFTVHNAKE